MKKKSHLEISDGLRAYIDGNNNQPTRGGKRIGAGRRPSGKVRLQCWVKPETKKALGQKPGPEIDKATDAMESLRSVIATDPRDWSIDRRDAWIWGLVIGWDQGSLDELKKIHGWTDDLAARLAK